MLTQSVTPVIYAAEMAVKHGDEVIEGGTSTLAQYGDDFGKMGTYVEKKLKKE